MNKRLPTESRKLGRQPIGDLWIFPFLALTLILWYVGYLDHFLIALLYIVAGVLLYGLIWIYRQPVMPLRSGMMVQRLAVHVMLIGIIATRFWLLMSRGVTHINVLAVVIAIEFWLFMTRLQRGVG